MTTEKTKMTDACRIAFDHQTRMFADLKFAYQTQGSEIYHRHKWNEQERLK